MKLTFISKFDPEINEKMTTTEVNATLIAELRAMLREEMREEMAKNMPKPSVVQPYVNGVISAASYIVGGLVKGIRSVLPQTRRELAFVAVTGTAIAVAWRVRKGKVILIRPSADTKKGIVAESVKAGSNPTSMSDAGCQIRVYTEGKDKSLLPIGWAIRFKDPKLSRNDDKNAEQVSYLVGPDHVFAEPGCFVLSKDKTKRFYLVEEGRTYLSLYTDLAAVAFTPAEMSQLGVKIAALAEVASCGTTAQVRGLDGMGTVGYLSHDPRCWGGLIYGGTTLPGYSGSAYTCGAKIMGMHSTGGKENRGVDASFIRICLKSATSNLKEDSESWLHDQYTKDNEIRYRFNGDEIQLFVNDRYHLVQPQSMAKVFGSDWMSAGSSGSIKKSRRKARDYDDSEVYESARVESAAKTDSTAVRFAEFMMESLKGKAIPSAQPEPIVLVPESAVSGNVVQPLGASNTSEGPMLEEHQVRQIMGQLEKLLYAGLQQKMRTSRKSLEEPRPSTSGQVKKGAK